jgi:hypothetical protein
VGGGKPLRPRTLPEADLWVAHNVLLHFGDSINAYEDWPRPDCIISDGAYGMVGWGVGTSDHLGIVDWYEAHIRQWSARAKPSTTLWFWNSEIGWATAHPVLDRHGWRFVNANVWYKGKGHIIGHVNTAKMRRFPVVTELCVQYVFEPRINGLLLKEWLLHEWERTGLPLKEANTACGVRDAAVRKYLNQGCLWYSPPPDKFAMIAEYANQKGRAAGRPYFSRDGERPMSREEWASMRPKFNCPRGATNVWERKPLRGEERVTTATGAVDEKQKPLDLMERMIAASTDEGDVVWEPFGGLFTGALAACRLNRRAYAGEMDLTYFQHGLARFVSEAR